MTMRLQKSGAYSSLLSIGRADPRLNGNYTCTASNAAATAQYTASLHVDGKYHWSITATEINRKNIWVIIYNGKLDFSVRFLTDIDSVAVAHVDGKLWLQYVCQKLLIWSERLNETSKNLSLHYCLWPILYNMVSWYFLCSSSAVENRTTTFLRCTGSEHRRRLSVWRRSSTSRHLEERYSTVFIVALAVAWSA